MTFLSLSLNANYSKIGPEIVREAPRSCRAYPGCFVGRAADPELGSTTIAEHGISSLLRVSYATKSKKVAEAMQTGLRRREYFQFHCRLSIPISIPYINNG